MAIRPGQPMTCCDSAKEWISWQYKDRHNLLDKDGWAMTMTDKYGEHYGLNMNFCPFCGYSLPSCDTSGMFEGET
jgi:hypothetical protein